MNENAFIDSQDSTDFGAFNSPQLILKLSWLSADKRFHARIVRQQPEKVSYVHKGYVSVHFTPDALPHMDTASLV